jgi:hypothetical protein
MSPASRFFKSMLINGITLSEILSIEFPHAFMRIHFDVSCEVFSCFNVLQLLKAYANKAFGVQTYNFF